MQGCLPLFLFIIVLLVWRSVLNIWHTISSPFKPQNDKRSTGGQRQRATNTSHGGGNSRQQRRRKMFEDNEGEYVDYVEVK